MSASSSSPRTEAPIHSLPHEVLRQVLEHNLVFVDETNEVGEEYLVKERYTYLRLCSLVHSSWRKAAQSLLWYSLDFWEGSAPFPEDVASSPVAGQYKTKQAWFVGYQKAKEVRQLERVLGRLRGVEIVGLSGIVGFRLKTLAHPSLADLKVVSLNECASFDMAQVTSFPFQLHSLRVSSLESLPESTLAALFETCTTSLHSLHLYVPSDPVFEALLQRVWPSIADNITTFSLSYKNDRLPALLLSQCPRVARLNLHLTSEEGLREALSALDHAIEEIEIWSLWINVLLEHLDLPVLSRLKVVYLPFAEFADVMYRSRDGSEFIDRCEERDIEICYEDSGRRITVL